jgi:hypothetical protein
MAQTNTKPKLTKTNMKPRVCVGVTIEHDNTPHERWVVPLADLASLYDALAELGATREK